MVKLKYKSTKWDKGVANYKKVSATIPGGSSGLNNVDLYVKRFADNSDKDYIELYRGLSAAFQNIAKGIYLCDSDNPLCFDYIFLSGMSFAITDTLLKQHYPTKRNVFNHFSTKQQEMKYALIATNQTDLEYLKTSNDIISYTLTKQNKKAKELLDKIEGSANWQGHLIDYCYVKDIYEAIFRQDTAGFNLALTERIKRYRKNMVDYFPIIDVTSIALIKMAKINDIECDVDVIEIPQFFINNEYQIDTVEVASKLPFYKDVMNIISDDN